MLTTPTELKEFLDSWTKLRDGDAHERLRYVIYVRKSTDERGKQTRSLSDQLAACEELAKKLELKVVKKIQEAESAKEPGIRREFRKMLEDIKSGKYDGIIAWHPDRLARNMKEGGEIIDLIDREIIKDLKFVSFTFESNTTGKMLLGIAFVLSKQYSDKLGDDVRRGMMRSIKEGRWLHKPKLGYYKDVNQFLRPDGYNFQLIKQAWFMRLDGATLEKVAVFLNENELTKAEGVGNKKHKPVKVDKRKLFEMFRDPFYAGVMEYGDQRVDLTSVYDFVPVVSVEDFLKLNKVKDLQKVFAVRMRGRRGAKPAKSELLRGKVLCAYCGKPMTTSVTVKKLSNGGERRYFYYRCDTPRCKVVKRGKRVNLNVRGHVVVDFAKDLLQKMSFATRGVYDHYVREMRRINRERVRDLKSKIKRLEIGLRTQKNKIDKIKDYLLHVEDSEIKRVYELELKEAIQNVRDIKEKIERLKEDMVRQKQAIMKYREFIERMQDLPDIIAKTKSLEKLDFYLGRIFSNFTVDKNGVSGYTLNTPFDELVKKGFVTFSGRERTRTSDLLDVNETL